MTATILAGPAAANRAPVIVIIMPQTLINLAPSTTPVTTQAILATAVLEEQPIQPPVLGQGFESGQTQGGTPAPETLFRGPVLPLPIQPQEPGTDYVEPYEAPPENPMPGEPAEPATPAAQPKAARDAEPVESIVLEPIQLTQWAKAPAVPVVTPGTEITAHEDYPTYSLATMVGTAAVASGGYHLVFGGSNRFNQRWLPTRRSSSGSGTRKSGLPE